MLGELPSLRPYDAAGNLLGDGVWVYQYDAVNRLRVMERDYLTTNLPASQDVRLEFRYDEQNRRVEKTVKDRISGTVRSRERYLYEGWNLVATLKVAGEGATQTATLVSRYVWRTSSRETGAFGLLMVAGDHDGNPATARRGYYPGYDGRGNLTSLADNVQGVAAVSREYSPFGKRVRSEAGAELPDPASLGAHFGFATQYTDNETGLVYFGHRYYHPGLGRFLTRDPLGEAGGLNRYAYALNDPVNMTDYRGLWYNGPVQTYGSIMMDTRIAGLTSGLPHAGAPEGMNNTSGSSGSSPRPGSGTSDRGFEIIGVNKDGQAMVVVTDRTRFEAVVYEFESRTGMSATVDIRGYDSIAMTYNDDTLSLSLGGMSSAGGTGSGTTAWSTGVYGGPSVGFLPTIAGNGFTISSLQAQSNPSNGSYTWSVAIAQMAKLPFNANGLIIQKIMRTYHVLDAGGNPVQSADPKVNGNTTIVYYEAWEVKAGQVGISVNGAFHPAETDTFTFAAWPTSVVSGTQQITGIMVYIPGATITNEYSQDSNPHTNWWSGNLPYTAPNAPQAWDASGGTVRRVTGTYDQNSQEWKYNILTGNHP